MDSLNKWEIIYENDTGCDDENFREWWIITNGEMSFEATSEKEAEWLYEQLNNLTTS